jgi:phosphoserine aminotransferase
MKRVHNFAPGPAALPLEVLLKAQAELPDFNGSGMSVMEISHRSKDFTAVSEGAESLLRELMNIPDNYRVLFLQGGASLQFAMVPMNLMHRTRKAYYINSGNFAKKAAKEARLFGEVIEPASSEDCNYAHLPEIDGSLFRDDADYIHFTYNNTIYGTEFHDVPVDTEIPVVSDMTSCVLSEPVDVSKYGLIYAGAQKNIGPAGLAVVIIRDDLLGLVPGLPSMLDYQIHAKNNSMYNTPPTFCIYMAKLVFEWLRDQGGVEGIHKVNLEKADMLYSYLDSSSLFRGIVDNRAHRSIMSVTFTTGDKELDERFSREASENGLTNLKGHRIAGGMRASIYNAVTLEDCRALVEFMKEFERRN